MIEAYYWLPQWLEDLYRPEVGLDYKIPVNIDNGDQFEEDYLRLVQQSMPAIVDHDPPDGETQSQFSVRVPSDLSC